jgi:hypothetical protein
LKSEEKLKQSKAEIGEKSQLEPLTLNYDFTVKFNLFIREGIGTTETQKTKPATVKH